MGFGKYAVIDNVRYHLEKEPDMWWEFKPPTAREEIAINRFTQGGSVRTSVQGIERRVVTDAEIALEELALTFADSNFEDEEKRILLRPSDNLDKRREVISTFPKEMFYELWRALGEACPGWGAVPIAKAPAEVGPKSDKDEAGEPKKEESSSSS